MFSDRLRPEGLGLLCPGDFVHRYQGDDKRRNSQGKEQHVDDVALDDENQGLREQAKSGEDKNNGCKCRDDDLAGKEHQDDPGQPVLSERHLPFLKAIAIVPPVPQDTFFQLVHFQPPCF